MEYSSKKGMSKIILVVVAHPDDEVLGCGASIAKWSALGYSVQVVIMAEGATSRDPLRDRNARVKDLLMLSESAYRAGEVLSVSSVKILDAPDNRMDSLNLLDVIKLIEKEVDRLKPHTVVTHHGGDLNVDHRIVYDAVITACRPLPNFYVRRLLTFETVSSTEWSPPGFNLEFSPNYFEDVSKFIDIKIKALSVYNSEMREWPHPRSLDNVKNLAKLRGSSVGMEAAEAFTLLRELK